MDAKYRSQHKNIREEHGEVCRIIIEHGRCKKHCVIIQVKSVRIVVVSLNQLRHAVVGSILLEGSNVAIGHEATFKW